MHCPWPITISPGPRYSKVILIVNQHVHSVIIASAMCELADCAGISRISSTCPPYAIHSMA